MLIEYKDVEIRQDNIVVLQDLDFTLEKGQFVYLLGKVGSGKSSFLKSLYAELPIAAGQAHILDYNLRKIKRKHIPLLRRKLGIIFQDFQLLNDRTIAENLHFVLRATGWKNRRAIAERIDYVLTTVGMATKGYKRPHQLSGGEQQRVVIARALLNSPEIILADEPTGNLDQYTARDLVALLHDIAGNGTSVIMATHNIALVEQFPAEKFHFE
jgi:cell division transport system ATP-binding protein